MAALGARLPVSKCLWIQPKTANKIKTEKWLVAKLIDWLIDSFIHSFIHPFIHPSIHPSIHSGKTRRAKISELERRRQQQHITYDTIQTCCRFCCSSQRHLCCLRCFHPKSNKQKQTCQKQIMWSNVSCSSQFNPLDSKGNNSSTSNNTMLIHWPLMVGLLHLVHRGGAWAGCGSAQSPPRCTKCNSPPINGQCTNHCIAVWWSVALRF